MTERERGMKRERERERKDEEKEESSFYSHIIVTSFTGNRKQWVQFRQLIVRSKKERPSIER